MDLKQIVLKALKELGLEIAIATGNKLSKVAQSMKDTPENDKIS